MPKLLHVADVHLDASYAWLGRKGQAQRQRLRETFQRIVSTVIEERFDLLLIAGDLFDSNAPSQRSVDFVRAQLSRLTVPVCILPGTHDCLAPGSIYHKVDFTTASAAVHVFSDPRRTSVTFPALNVAVHARPNTSNSSPESPLAGLVRAGEARWQVAMAHGSVTIPGQAEDYPISSAGIAATGMDYVALGHWHSPHRVAEAPVPAWYSGSPEPVAIDQQQSGCVLAITLDGARAGVEQRRVGTTRLDHLDLYLDTVTALEEVKAPIRTRAHAEAILAVDLRGMRGIDLDCDAAELEQELGPLFFHLAVADRSHLAVSAIDADEFPEELVTGKFIRLMKRRVEQATSVEERVVCEQALQLGYALLQGREVL